MYPAENPEILEAATQLHDPACECGVSLPDAAVQGSLHDERIDTTIVGFSKPDVLCDS